MATNKLSWISDERLEAAIATLRYSANAAIHQADQRQQRNVIDPFSSLLIATAFNIAREQSLRGVQSSSSALRGMSNALGAFHQEILSSVAGWANHDAGYDLENPARQMLAEVKNKHNTMNASNREKVIADLDIAVRQKGRGWTGYLVVIVPKVPNRYETRIGPSETRPIYEIDGASFYQKATNDENALHDLFDVLCDALKTSDEIAYYCRQIMSASLPARNC